MSLGELAAGDLSYLDIERRKPLLHTRRRISFFKLNVNVNVLLLFKANVVKAPPSDLGRLFVPKRKVASPKNM